jgi:hypothetical protein
MDGWMDGIRAHNLLKEERQRVGGMIDYRTAHGALRNIYGKTLDSNNETKGARAVQGRLSG